MSLDTIVKIGKVFRESSDNFKYFKYIDKCTQDENTLYLNIPVDMSNDYHIDTSKVNVVPENKRSELYYLKYKTSDNDGMVKYLFGDIWYGLTNKKAKEGIKDESGYYRLEDMNRPNAAFRPSSFKRGLTDYESMISSIDSNSAIQLHEATARNLFLIERILKYSPAIKLIFDDKSKYNFSELIFNDEKLYNLSLEYNYTHLSKKVLDGMGITQFPLEDDVKSRNKLFNVSNLSIFLHFDFNGKHWYEYSDALDLVMNKFLEEFVDKDESGLVLKKTLYKTLCSGDSKNDIQFPGFKLQNKYKSKSFTENELLNLFYGIDYSNGLGKMIPGTNIKLIVLPKGDDLLLDDYLEYQQNKNEQKLVVSNNNLNDAFFDFLEFEDQNITCFDFIFCKKGSSSSPDVDLIEISNIEKSQLLLIRERLNDISNKIYQERANWMNTTKELVYLNPYYSLKNILGTPYYNENTKQITISNNPMYQTHILKILPQIYSGNYNSDNLLLPCFIKNTESTILKGDAKYSFLKYDFKYLMEIQNNQNNSYMEIVTSQSYSIGLLLGRMAQNLAREINSFEKNYVGTLSRRISSLPDFLKLKADIEEKLIMHDKAQFTHSISFELAQIVKQFSSNYDKYECSFGFFEGYYEPHVKKEKQENQSEN